MEIYKLTTNGKDEYFESQLDMIKTLSKRRLDILEYNFTDKYEAVCDIGYPFYYWTKGTVMNITEWVIDARKQLRYLEGKSDLEIIYGLITKDYLWKKCE